MKKIRDKEVKWQELLPLVILLGFVPLVFRVHTHTYTPDEALLFPNSHFNDLYSYYKSKLIIGLMLIALVIFIYQVAKKRIHLEKSAYTVFAGIYAAAILFSAALSPYDIAFSGLVDRFEGAWTLLSYVAIFFMCIHYGRQHNAIDVLTHTLMGSSIFVGFVGFLQYVGYDPYTRGFLRFFSFPRQVWDTIWQTVRTTFDTGVVASLYNPNFMGSYAAMTTLLSLGYLLSNKGGKKARVFYLIANLVSFSALVGSRSSAGLLGFAAGIIILILLMPEAFKEKGKQLAGLIAAWAGMIVVMSMIYSNMWDGSRLIQQDYFTLAVYFLYFVAATVLYRAIFNRRDKNKALLGLTIAYAGIVMVVAAMIYTPLNTATYKAYYGMSREERSAERYKNREKLKDVVITKDKIEIYEADGDFIAFKIKDNQVFALDEEGNNLGFENTKPGHYQVEAEGYEKYKLVMTKIKGVDDQIFAQVPNFNLWVILTEDGLAYKGRDHKPAQIQSPPKMGFTGRESLFTNRGYIWSRTLPLMKDHILLGAGPDCFVFEFPQYEYIAKWNSNQQAYLLYDKPHNWYLQMGMNTGLLSMLSVIAMGILLLIQSIKKFMLEGQSDRINVTLIAMTFAYAAAGIFNDSVVHVAPIFWVVFGLSVGAVNGLKQPKKAKQAAKKGHKKHK